MRSFFRFQPSPDYPGYPAFYNELPVPAVREVYPLPVRQGDEIKFILDKPLDVDATTLKIAVSDGETLVLLEAGTLEVGQTQLFATVRIPDTFDFGCYRFVLYGQADNSTAWSYVSHVCETDSLGRPTGWAMVTEGRDSAFTPFALLESNPFQVGVYTETVFVEYENDRNAFGFLYEDYPDFETQSFRQKVRLHLVLTQPKHTISESVYRKTDGQYRVQNVQFGKKYKLKTGYLDEPTHDALSVALKHSTLIIDARMFACEGVLEPEFTDIAINVRRHTDLYPAEVDVVDEGFADTNVDCGSDDGIETPCPNTYTFAVDSVLNMVQIAPNVFETIVGEFARVFLKITPFGGGVRYTYEGDLPQGLQFLLINDGLINDGIQLTGVCTQIESKTVTLFIKNGVNTCGSVTLTFNVIAPPPVALRMNDYSEHDYSQSDYN